jgi:hypothetical protein
VLSPKILKKSATSNKISWEGSDFSALRTMSTWIIEREQTSASLPFAAFLFMRPPHFNTNDHMNMYSYIVYYKKKGKSNNLIGERKKTNYRFCAAVAAAL